MTGPYYFTDKNGTLAKLVIDELPFIPKEVFLVYNTPKDQVRGGHAHKQCTQLVKVLSGRIKISLTHIDGEYNVKILDRYTPPLLIPINCWSEQQYLDENTILQVICSHLYDEEDYIRDLSIFRKLQISYSQNLNHGGGSSAE